MVSRGCAIAFFLFGLGASPTPSASAGEPISAEHLAEIRRSLDSYLSRIRAIRMSYTRRWQPDEGSVVWQSMQRMLEVEFREREKRSGVESANRARARMAAPSVEEYKLLDAYPSMRLERMIRRELPDGSSDVEHVVQIAHENQRVQVDLHHKVTHVASSIDYNVFSDLPTFALGMHVIGKLDTSIVAFLEHPRLTTIEGEETVAGLDTIVLKVGPSLPDSIASGLFTQEGYARLWLAPSLNHLPVRIELVRSPSVTVEDGSTFVNLRRYELADFRPVVDEARGEEIPFPHEALASDPGGASRFLIRDVVVNPPITTADFSDPTPEDFLVSKDGAVPHVDARGGGEVREGAEAEPAEKARELLERSPPPRSAPPRYASARVLVPVAFGAAIVALIFLRRFPRTP